MRRKDNRGVRKQDYRTRAEEDFLGVLTRVAAVQLGKIWATCPVNCFDVSENYRLSLWHIPIGVEKMRAKQMSELLSSDLCSYFIPSECVDTTSFGILNEFE